VTALTLYLRTESIGSVDAAVIIVYYNSFGFVKRLFHSLASQDYDLERLLVVLVDNSSPDMKTEEIAALAERLFPNYAVARLRYNLGFAAANNLGIKLVEQLIGRKEPVIILLNPDTYLISRKFLRTAATLGKQLEAVIGFVTLSGQKTEIIDGLGGYVDRLGSARDILCCEERRGFKELAYKLHPRLYLSPLACFAATAIPWRVLKRLGLLREDYFMYFEDTEYSLRAWSQGVPVVIVRDELVWHARGGTQKPQSGGDAELTRARYSIAIHFMKNILVLSYEYLGLSVALARFIVAVGTGLVRGKADQVGRAAWEALRTIVSGRAKKRRLPKSVVPRSPRTIALLWSAKSFIAGLGGVSESIRFGLKASNIEYIMCRLRSRQPWRLPRC